MATLVAAACDGNEASADVNAQVGEYGTALQEAAYYGEKEKAEMLLKAGADVNAQGGFYGSALQAAAAHFREKEIIEMLPKAGADVNAQGGEYEIALQAAAAHFREIEIIEIIEMLLKAGADVNAQGGFYGSALQAAAASGEKDIVEILLKAGADVNAQGGQYGTALQAAVARGEEETVKLLLRNKASTVVDSQARDGSSLLHAAVASRNIRTLDTLICNGADKFLGWKNSSGQTPFLLAVSLADLEISERLYSHMKDKSAAIEERDIDGRTPLHLAVEKEDIKLVRWLLDEGAKTNIPDFGDTTPFQRASELRNFEILCRLFSGISEEQRLIDASSWRSISQVANGTIKMTKGDSPTVEVLSEREFYQCMNDEPYFPALSLVEIPAEYMSLAGDTTEKLLFLIADDNLPQNAPPWGLRYRWWRKTAKGDKWNEGTYRPNLTTSYLWTAKPDTIPSAVTLSNSRPGECNRNLVLMQSSFLECRLILPVFISIGLEEIPSSLDAPLGRLRREHSIVWIMVKPKSTNTGQNTGRRLLKSTTFFSTLEHAAVPDTATDLCGPLIAQLKGEWNGVCKAAEEHLNERRIKVLKSRGLQAGLIENLLHDAMLWGQLNKLLEDQAMALIGNFEVKSWELLYEQEHRELAQILKKNVDKLVEELRGKLNSLIATSQELIQLEFNLTSIAEAQKSTIMNRSMKRLSWITFVFLPLMFIASLFGMNIDLLESNPGWWWYLLFSIGTTILTFAVWIIFRNCEGSENRSGGRFQWPVKQEIWDEEKGCNGETKNAWFQKAKIS